MPRSRGFKHVIRGWQILILQELLKGLKDACFQSSPPLGTISMNCTWRRCVAGGGEVWQQINKNRVWLDLLAKGVPTTALLCSQTKCNKGNSLDTWDFVSAALELYASGSACLGAMQNESTPDHSGRYLVPCTWELLYQDNPKLLLPPNTILIGGSATQKTQTSGSQDPVLQQPLQQLVHSAPAASASSASAASASNAPAESASCAAAASTTRGSTMEKAQNASTSQVTSSNQPLKGVVSGWVLQAEANLKNARSVLIHSGTWSASLVTGLTPKGEKGSMKEALPCGFPMTAMRT